jgi:hypothetical protein
MIPSPLNYGDSHFPAVRPSFSLHIARALRAAGLETTPIQLLDPTPYPSVTSEVEPLRLAFAALHLKCVEILYKYEFSYLDAKSIRLNATVGKSGSSWRADVVTEKGLLGSAAPES